MIFLATLWDELPRNRPRQILSRLPTTAHSTHPLLFGRSVFPVHPGLSYLNLTHPALTHPDLSPPDLSHSDMFHSDLSHLVPHPIHLDFISHTGGGSRVSRPDRTSLLTVRNVHEADRSPVNSPISTNCRLPPPRISFRTRGVGPRQDRLHDGSRSPGPDFISHTGGVTSTGENRVEVDNEQKWTSSRTWDGAEVGTEQKRGSSRTGKRRDARIEERRREDFARGKL